MKVYDIFNEIGNRSNIYRYVFDKLNTESYYYSTLIRYLPKKIREMILNHRVKKHVDSVFEEVKSITPINDNNWVLIEGLYKDSSDGINEFELNLYRKIDIEDNFEEKPILEKLNKEGDLSPSVLRKLSMENVCQSIESYGFEASPWEEIMAYDVDNEVFINHTCSEIVSYIIFEMTYFGWSNEDVQKNTQKILDDYESEKDDDDDDDSIHDEFLEMLEDFRNSKDNETKKPSSSDNFPNCSDEEVIDIFEMKLLTYNNLKDYVRRHEKKLTTVEDEYISKISDDLIKEYDLTLKELD